MGRETAKDIEKENKLFTYAARTMSCDYINFPSDQGKYRIDGYLYKDKEILFWVECKWLSKEGFMGLNAPKYIEGCELAAWLKIPFIYLFRIPGKVGYIIVHDGMWTPGSASLKRCGGTPPGRAALWDDVEPMVMFDSPDIIWI